MPRTITIALDVDGVVCPAVHPDDVPKIEARTGWTYHPLPEPLERFVVAEPVIQTLHELDAICTGTGVAAPLWEVKPPKATGGNSGQSGVGCASTPCRQIPPKSSTS